MENDKMTEEEKYVTEMMAYQESVFIAVLPALVAKHDSLGDVIDRIVSRAHEYAVEARFQRYGE